MVPVELRIWLASSQSPTTSGHVYFQVVMLKVLWDVVWLVRNSFSDWNKTLWSDIDVEQMETECKKFVKVR